MKICSFFGQKMIYDKYLKAKILKSLKEVLSCDSSFVFYFFFCDKFSWLCLSAVKQLKKEYKDKKIEVFYVGYSFKYIKYSPPSYKTPEMEMANPENYDSVFIPSVADEKIQWYFNSIRIQRWLIEKSDFIFCYLYNKNELSGRGILSLLNRQADRGQATVIDLVYKGTKSRIKKLIATLPKDMQYIYGQLDAGVPQNKLSGELGISTHEIFSIYLKITQILSVLEQEIGS